MTFPVLLNINEFAEQVQAGRWAFVSPATVGQFILEGAAWVEIDSRKHVRFLRNRPCECIGGCIHGWEWRKPLPTPALPADHIEVTFVIQHDVAELENCPKCRHLLLTNSDHAHDAFCPSCGWTLPPAWGLFHLLRKAGNWVQDDTLRATITNIAPPELRHL